MLALPVLNIATFATGVIAVTTCELVEVPLLLFVFESIVVVVAKAMFVKLPPPAETTVTEKFVFIFAESFAIVGHVTKLLTTLAAAGAALTNVNPVGS